MSELGTVLHVGCGVTKLPEWVVCSKEIRLDIDARFQPDIVADMRNLGGIGVFDGVFCNHALEHLSREDALTALKEFKRVLRKGGTAVVVVPDLENVKATDQVYYTSPAGPITGADMYWGKQSMLKNFPEMAHKFGYIERTLRGLFEEAGFKHIATKREEVFNLMAVGTN